MNLNITVSIDDVNPCQNFKIIGEQTEKWFRQLNDEFGAKFDLFCPANFHNQYPLSQNQSWLNELQSVDFLSLNCHGFYHQCENPKQYGEMEFAEIQDKLVALERIQMIEDEWQQPLYEMGWRNPGWMCSEQSKYIIERNFKFSAIHYEHNHGMQWKCKTFFGHDGIQQENIGIHNISDDGQTGMIMFQSHIAGVHNHNVWNQNNFDQLRLSLSHVVEQYECEFKTLKECL